MTRTAERAEFLADVLTTAVEGGIGYWAELHEYAWRCVGLGEHNADALPEREGSSAMAVIQDHEHDELPEPVTVTLDTIAKALGMVRDGKANVHESYVARIKLADRENDAGEIDAADADIIVQLATLGSVVYG